MNLLVSKNALTIPDGLFEHLVHLGHDEIHIRKFRNALRDSGRSSVDAFLEHRPDYVEVGKAAIAGALLPRESQKVMFSMESPHPERWYEYLFNRLNSKFEDLGRNKVSFLTFNYDRSLEFYLLTAICNAYDKKFPEAKAILDGLRIVHLHGDLGPITEADFRRWLGRAVPGSKEIAAAAKGIEIMHAATAKSFAIGRNFISEAEVVCFLGFGYHPLNIDRLLDSVQKLKITAVGTGHGMGVAERLSAEKLIQGWLPQFEIDQGNSGALSFLRNKYHWW